MFRAHNRKPCWQLAVLLVLRADLLGSQSLSGLCTCPYCKPREISRGAQQPHLRRSPLQQQWRRPSGAEAATELGQCRCSSVAVLLLNGRVSIERGPQTQESFSKTGKAGQ